MKPIQTSFNAGQWSPLLEGRVDLEKYDSALFRCEGFLLDPRGPAHLCPGLRYIAGTKTNASVSRLIPFEFSVTQAYILEFGDLYIRFYRDQAQILDGGSPYEIVSPYAAADLAALKWTQSADVLYLFHEDHEPRKLSRTGHTSWTLSIINFRPPAISEQGLQPAATLTPAAVSGTAVTFTAGSAVFLSGDVGRLLTSGVGRASIVAFLSTTQVQADIIDDFASTDPIAAGSWSMLGSPDGTLTASAVGPVGKIITLTGSDESEAFAALLGQDQDYWTVSASGTNEYYLENTAPGYTATEPSNVYIDDVQAATGTLGSLGVVQWGWGDNDTLGYNTIYVRLSDGADPDDKSTVLDPDNDFLQRSTISGDKDIWRTTDVGKYVRINSGLVRITSYTSTTVVSGEVVKELVSIDAATAWTLEDAVWSATNGFPSSGTFFEDRLVLAGSTAFPETVWGSVVGDYENFTPGIDDADSFAFTLNSRKVQVIRWIEPREYLVIGTASGIWRLGPEDTGDPLTPLNVDAKEESSRGSADILPVTIDSATLFVQRAARKIREFVYHLADDGYRAPDLTLLAEDITLGGLAEIAYQEEPFSIVWGRLVDGTLVALSYLRDQDVIGWSEFSKGTIESLAVIPGDGYDEVWAVVNRTVNGSVVRYVEMLEQVFRDDPATYAENLGLNAFFLDSGITYNGAATTTITGLDHLEGEAVTCLVNGAVLTGQTVSSGQITLPISATVVHVGLWSNATLQLQRLEGSLRSGGTLQGERKKIDELTVRVLSSGVFRAGPDESNLDDVRDREQSLVMGGPYPLYTGDLEMGYDGGWEQDARPMIRQTMPLPLTVLAVMADVDV